MMENQEIEHEEFRDHIATVDEFGRRIWVYPKKPVGWYYNLRTYVSWVLLALLFGLPFIKVGGSPLFLFNVLKGEFILFGILFTPQDMHMFALAMITLMVFIVLFTVIFGRLFCGWVCPQTIFMEMVFRKIEYWIEGDSNAQKRLNKAPWSSQKIWKKVFKHGIFFIISILIANIFLSYVIGVDEVGKIAFEPVRDHLGGFIAMIVFSLVFYGVFAFFREQVCIAVCPYGRLQSVLLVKSSIVVIYDWIRGEPRGKKRKVVAEDAPKLGDCVDCHLCVQVCPTGIDIRNGTQLECVNCTACMDACDDVMEKIGREKGLIRYDSYENIEEGKTKILTPRVWAYSGALMALVLFQAFLFSTRADVETLILRTPGMLFQENEKGEISNLYNYQIVNKTADTISNIELKLGTNNGKIRLVGVLNDIGPGGVAEGAFFVDMQKSTLMGRKTDIPLKIFVDGELIETTKTTFLGPIK